MCGIFGAIRKLSATGCYGGSLSNDALKNFTANAMVASQIRGSDSTGIIKINQGYKIHSYTYNVDQNLPKEDCRKVWVYKLPEPAERFVGNPKVKQLFDSVNSFTIGFIGHTRNASQANPLNNRNNHPHQVGGIIGVHNGSIANWRQLVKKFDLKLKSNCDSEVIFALIEKFVYKDGKTLKEAIKNTSFYLEGRYACVVLDVRDVNKIGFFRNNAPLSFRYRGTNSTLYFASTHEILSGAYRKSKIDSVMISPYYLDAGEIILPDEHGYVLDQLEGFTDDWVKKANPFELK